MSLGFWQIALIVLLFLLLFGRGRIPQLMGDLAEGIKSFRNGIGGDGSGEESEKGNTERRPEAGILPGGSASGGEGSDSAVVETDAETTRPRTTSGE